ncbi:peptidoglycan DD-metalloendopeptidase family protein [Denitratisoma oestradiolicum]|uniref:Lipoprotein NlpD/LppB homolog n=1 Tax=Denitratisoma oestradiolicum TaxID=311182 RepID=A0A6S6XW54_9PROT|nr:peptidoglycan DD-metalloendopeptidase family protein [Denitratisoma oestradiolicum]CAB1368473.1 Lipoprotein NlpD/LppB homolog [Denitratisoma oestradiolicum]
MSLRLLSCVAVILLAACASHEPVPVEDRTAAIASAATPARAAVDPVVVPPGYYLVKKGDTLYGIALDHGHSYRDLAAWNNLEDPNRILVGQQLRVASPDSADPVVEVRPVTGPVAVESRPVVTAAAAVVEDSLVREPKGGKQPYSEEVLARLRQPEPMQRVAVVPAPAEKAIEKPAVAVNEETVWAWPSAGKLLAGFSEGSNKGVDLAGKPGDPVLAAGSGKVVYAGTGLRGYGKLVIVKHDATFLSAYAHNSQILVKEGQSVTRGQKIAEVGSSDADQPKLHFEIRRQGKPVDPTQYLPKR